MKWNRKKKKGRITVTVDRKCAHTLTRTRIRIHRYCRLCQIPSNSCAGKVLSNFLFSSFYLTLFHLFFPFFFFLHVRIDYFFNWIETTQRPIHVFIKIFARINYVVCKYGNETRVSKVRKKHHKHRNTRVYILHEIQRTLNFLNVSVTQTTHMYYKKYLLAKKLLLLCQYLLLCIKNKSIEIKGNLKT